MALTYLLLSIIIALISLILYWMQRTLNYWKNRGIPYEKPHIFFGNVQGFRKNRTVHQAIIDHYNKFRNHKMPFVGFYFMNKPTAFITDTKLAKNILIKDFSNFADRGMFYNERDDPLSAHLFSLDGIMWKQLRHKLSPTFTSGKMKHMFPTVIKVSEEFIKVVGEQVTGKSGGGVNLEMKDLNARFTTDVIGTCAFGIECNTLRDATAQFGIIGRKAFTENRHNTLIMAFLIGFPKLARRLRMRMIHDDVHNFFMNLVQQTVALREQEQLRRNDFMDMLIDLKNNKVVKNEQGEELTGLTLNEIAAQAFVFFLAGFETSSSTMSYALYELAQHQHIQDKVRQEIKSVLEQHEQVLSYECIKNMKYLDQVIFETLRLYTLVPHLNRIALNDYIVPGHAALKIEAGTSIIIPACAYHRDPELYPEPQKFDPERFSPEMVAARDSVEFLGFGDGPRNCIGMRFGQMQTRVGLAQLLRNFKFSVCERTDIPLKFNPKSFVMGTVGGIYLKVERV